MWSVIINYMYIDQYFQFVKDIFPLFFISPVLGAGRGEKTKLRNNFRPKSTPTNDPRLWRRKKGRTENPQEQEVINRHEKPPSPVMG